MSHSASSAACVSRDLMCSCSLRADSSPDMAATWDFLRASLEAMEDAKKRLRFVQEARAHETGGQLVQCTAPCFCAPPVRGRSGLT